LPLSSGEQMERISFEPLENFWSRFRPWRVRPGERDALIQALQRLTDKLYLENIPDGLVSKPLFHWLNLEALGEYTLASAWLSLAAIDSPLASTILSARLAGHVTSQPERAGILRLRASAIACLGRWTVKQIEDDLIQHRRDIDAASMQLAEKLEAPKNDLADDREQLNKVRADLADALFEPAVVEEHVRIIRNAIFLSGDREVNGRLRNFRRLEEPVRCVIVDPDWRRHLNEPRWLKPVADQIGRRLMAFRGKRLRLPPLLLVGPPGCGKSRFVADLAAALDVPMLPLSFAGQSDSRALVGTSRGWGSAAPSVVIDAVLRHKVANPLVFVDEIEKSQGSHSGDPISALLMLTEPETAQAFHDPFLQTEADLSHVVWIAGANSLRGLSSPILSRFTVIDVDAPDGRDWPAVRASFLQEMAAMYGLPEDGLPQINPEVDSMLLKLLDQKRDLRIVKRVLEEVIGAAIEEQVALPN
jgi:hypothetical protein